MEKNFDFGALFKTQYEKPKKHKTKPSNFVSVAGGIQKRLESSIKNRKSNRLTSFDTIRELPKCPSPAPISEAQQKMEHRRQQLEKWKMEKEQKKKELAAQKKKPFITGVARNPIKFVPPPPLTKPSSSSRVTRSMTRSTLKPVKPSPKNSTQSFAPKNATFKPPELKNLVKLPKLAPPSKTKIKRDITFEPVVNTSNTAKQSRTSQPLVRQNAIETSSSLSMTEKRYTRNKVRKPSPKKPLQSSSSSSDMEWAKPKNKSLRKSFKEPKPLNPKVLSMVSTSDEKSTAESSDEKPKRKSLRSTYVVKDSESSSNKTSTDMEPSCDELVPTVNILRMSLPKNFSPSISSSDRISSDVEFIESKPSVTKSRKSLPATPRNRVPRSESSSEEKLRSPKSPELALTPEKMEDAKNTPTVTMSRGKDNARKEMIWKMKEGLLDADASDADSVEHFRKQLASEVARITDLCNIWDKVSEQTGLPENVQEAILAAVGQGRLLVSQKLQQFGSLVERCARPDPRAALVTPADLQGFWDMVFIQVTNIDLRFKKLEELRQRNWIEDAPVVAKKTAAKPNGRAAAKKTKPAAATSKIQQMIAEKRKALQQQTQAAGEKTFDAGFFTVRSPVRSPAAPNTPANKQTLLKAVLSSEAKKASKSATPFAMLRASLLAKNAEHEGFAPLPQTPQTTLNSLATPGRSILKSTNIDAGKSGKKPIKVVLFHPSDSDDTDPFTTTDNYKHSDVYQSALDGDLIKFNDTEDNIDKENSPSPVMKTIVTRRQSKRLTLTTEAEALTPRRSSRTKRDSGVTEETKKTPSRTSSRKKAKEADASSDVKQKTKKSTRKKALQDNEDNFSEVNIPTPKRSSRRNKVTTIS